MARYMEPELTPEGQEINDYGRGYDFGSDPNYGAYYANGESAEFAEGFVDGRLNLYAMAEDEEGATRDPSKYHKVSEALQDRGLWAGIRKIEEMEA